MHMRFYKTHLQTMKTKEKEQEKERNRRTYAKQTCKINITCQNKTAPHNIFLRMMMMMMVMMTTPQQGERMMMTMPQHAQHFLRSDGKSCSAKARRRVLLCYKILLVNLGAFKLPASRRWPVLDMFVLPFHPARLSCRMPLFLTPDRLLHLVFTHIVFDW
jgi:hypothetical protein